LYFERLIISYHSTAKDILKLLVIRTEDTRQTLVNAKNTVGPNVINEIERT
jgi:hypothetical protein